MSSDKTPPPIPSSNPIRCVRFEGEAMGLHTAGYDRRRIEEAQEQAREWMNRNPGIEIVSVDSCFGKLLAMVTVWYR